MVKALWEIQQWGMTPAFKSVKKNKNKNKTFMYTDESVKIQLKRHTFWALHNILQYLYFRI